MSRIEWIKLYTMILIIVLCVALMIFTPVIINTVKNGCYLSNRRTLGTIRWGEVVKTTLYLHNVSFSPISIDSVETTCACTIGKVSQSSIPPFKQSTISILVDTKQLLPGQKIKSGQIILGNGRTINFEVRFKLIK